MSIDSTALVALLVQTLTDHKGQAVSEMDLREITSLTEYMIVCSATSNRHAATLADRCWVAAKAQGVEPLGKEGTDGNEWVLLDFGHVILHVMVASVREYYNLEEMWSLKPHKKEPKSPELDEN